MKGPNFLNTCRFIPIFQKFEQVVTDIRKVSHRTAFSLPSPHWCTPFADFCQLGHCLHGGRRIFPHEYLLVTTQLVDTFNALVRERAEEEGVGIKSIK